jgi:4-hydroxy 2-oxovalerate aldolase
MSKVEIYDVSLRDGNHAVKHQITLDQIEKYCTDADRAGVDVVEVGHGNGIGASSLQVGLAKHTDVEMLVAARRVLKNSKLSVHCMPGFATISRDVQNALECGADIIRIGCHCTEATVTKTHLNYLRDNNITAYSSLMMVHMASKETLLEECQKLESYGAQKITLMDSAGHLLPKDVTEVITFLNSNLEINVGFHAHNNLEMAVANSLAAVEAGSEIIDASICGFGAGAGNTRMEVLIAVLKQMNFETNVDLYAILDAADNAEKYLVNNLPKVTSTSIVSGLTGVFSGFLKHVQRISKLYSVDQRDIYFELGKRKVVGGQEDLIVDVAKDLSSRN